MKYTSPWTGGFTALRCKYGSTVIKKEKKSETNQHKSKGTNTINAAATESQRKLRPSWGLHVQWNHSCRIRFIDLQWGKWHYIHWHSAPDWFGMALCNFGCLLATTRLSSLSFRSLPCNVVYLLHHILCVSLSHPSLLSGGCALATADVPG